MSNKKNKALHWPIGIFLAIMAVVGLGVWTISVANSNPVVLDDFYFDTYQDVDENYGKIEEAQIKFDKNYKTSFNLNTFKIGSNSLILTVTSKDNTPIDNAIIKVRITRPFTKKQDIDLLLKSKNNGKYVFEDFNINQIGRWQILSKVQIGDAISFTKTDVNATK